jgi:uncharacterized cupredoxin-like copper-binding protein
VKNIGTQNHELVVTKTDRSAGDLIIDQAIAKVDEAASGTTIGEIEQDDLPSGASASSTFKLERGSYVLICNVAGHYQAGMRIGITVR